MDQFYKKSERYILHVDGDSFFASCEVAIDPSLRGKAVVTGKERGIVSAMTYEAKARGVVRGMPIFQLRKMFPDITVISSDYELYSLFSRRMIHIVQRYTDDVHEYSIDECFADVTEFIKKAAKEKNRDPKEAVRLIKDDLQRELGLTFSMGLAPSKVLAKIASKTQKPNGLTHITHETAEEFLKDVPIQKVWGIGRETSALLFKKGIRTALDFVMWKDETVRALVSKPYHEIYMELKGIGILSCSEEGEGDHSKSISRTRTFSPSSSDQKIIYSELSRNAEEACAAIRREKLVSGFFSFFIKGQDFRYYRYEVPLTHRTSAPEDILLMIGLHFDKIYRKELIYRATGVTLMNLRKNDTYLPDLFGTHIRTEKRNSLYSSIDTLLRKQGSESIYLCSSLRSKKRRMAALKNEKERPQAFIDHLPFPYLGEVV